MARVDDAHHFSKKKIMVNSFLGGIMWGVGSALGAFLIIAVLGFVLSRIDVVPFIADFIRQINTYSERQLNSPLPLPES
jgi:hypothetical protein